MSGAIRLGVDALMMFPPAEAERFGYDRDAQAVGIVHFGIGAFHRAHQAWYTDAAMNAGGRNWMIVGVSLRSAEVAYRMNPQQGLYTVTERSADGASTRLIGSVRDVLHAPGESEAVIDQLAAPATCIASLTITEKGYCRAADGGLDHALAGEESVYAYLAAGLRRRHDAGLPGLTLLSCDNLAGNGAVLARLMRAYLLRHDPDLLGWFERACTCPSSMVDRIVPATADTDREDVCDMLDGLLDEAAVITEPFSQWVIEDRFAGPRPGWEDVGAELVADVRPFETAKLRMLNGAHSALAYLGLARGHTYVHEAIADPLIAQAVQTLMDDAAATLEPFAGLDSGAYKQALLERFANPRLPHRLAQIAIDGSQKIPQRWLAPLAVLEARGVAAEAHIAALAAWINFVRGEGHVVDDPLAQTLRELWQASGRSGIAKALFGPAGLFAADWTAPNVALEDITSRL